MANLQDDAEELPRFVAAIEAGADLVSGWKQHRHDPLGKTLPSRLFNRVTAWVSGIKLHDFNCGYKAYRREIFDKVRLYGELHRYAGSRQRTRLQRGRDFRAPSSSQVRPIEVRRDAVCVAFSTF